MRIGIDVAKAELVVAAHPTAERWTVANDERGIRTLVERLRSAAPELIVLEATGGYELLNFAGGLEKALGSHALRVDVSVHNATNVSYKDFLSRYKEFALNPGRDVTLRLRMDM